MQSGLVPREGACGGGVVSAGRTGASSAVGATHTPNDGGPQQVRMGGESGGGGEQRTGGRESRRGWWRSFTSWLRENVSVGEKD